jgi:hypothetical protein
VSGNSGSYAITVTDRSYSRLLLQRPDIDISLKDNEGYTAFDLYNSTLVGTKPSPEEIGTYADLYTWGTNVCVPAFSGFKMSRLIRSSFVPVMPLLGSAIVMIGRILN